MLLGVSRVGIQPDANLRLPGFRRVARPAQRPAADQGGRAGETAADHGFASSNAASQAAENGTASVPTPTHVTGPKLMPTKRSQYSRSLIRSVEAARWISAVAARAARAAR